MEKFFSFAERVLVFFFLLLPLKCSMEIDVEKKLLKLDNRMNGLQTRKIANEIEFCFGRGRDMKKLHELMQRNWMDVTLSFRLHSLEMNDDANESDKENKVEKISFPISLMQRSSFKARWKSGLVFPELMKHFPNDFFRVFYFCSIFIINANNLLICAPGNEEKQYKNGLK